MIVDSMAANGADDAAGGGSSHGLACQLLAALPAFASEAALEAGVLLAARGRVSTVTLCALFTPLLRASPAARLVLRERLLLLRILPTAALPALVALLRAIPADVEIGDELKGELGGEIGGEIRGEIRGELGGEIDGEIDGELVRGSWRRVCAGWQRSCGKVGAHVILEHGHGDVCIGRA